MRSPEQQKGDEMTNRDPAARLNGAGHLLEGEPTLLIAHRLAVEDYVLAMRVNDYSGADEAEEAIGYIEGRLRERGVPFAPWVPE